MKITLIVSFLLLMTNNAISQNLEGMFPKENQFRFSMNKYIHPTNIILKYNFGVRYFINNNSLLGINQAVKMAENIEVQNKYHKSIIVNPDFLQFEHANFFYINSKLRRLGKIKKRNDFIKMNLVSGFGNINF